MKHLWEYDHPYYCASCDYFNKECHRDWESWKDFIEEFGNADEDMNLIIRWDWDLPMLKLVILRQRKGHVTSHDIPTDSSQEPEVRALLQKHWERIKENWEPFNKEDTK